MHDVISVIFLFVIGSGVLDFAVRWSRKKQARSPMMNISYMVALLLCLVGLSSAIFSTQAP